MRHTVGMGVLLHVARRRPALLVEAVRAFFANRRRGRLLPSTRYLEWRAHTAYGAVAPVEATDLIEFLSWRKKMRLLRTGA